MSSSQQFVCELCLEGYTDATGAHVPVSIPWCGHTFCARCLLEVEESDAEHSDKCPSCRRVLAGRVNDFPHNFALIEALVLLGQLAIAPPSSSKLSKSRKKDAKVKKNAPAKGSVPLDETVKPPRSSVFRKCKFFLLGTCKNGAECRFRHDAADGASSSPNTSTDTRASIISNNTIKPRAIGLLSASARDVTI